MFSVGFRIMPDESELFSKIVSDYRDSITEVYFAWPGEPSGRSPVAIQHGTLFWEEIRRIASLGIGLNLVLNAACYGSKALARDLAEHIEMQVGRAESIGLLSAVTTMSPLVARTVRRYYPHIDLRASVNMRLGTVKGMEYVADLFTSYNIQREYNRDPERLHELGQWAEQHGKRLHVLANSGCLNFCSFQTFHDNVVAHENEMRNPEPIPGITTLCRHFYQDRKNWANFLAGSWIRPEDIAEHSRFFPGTYKLATRMHENPRQVIHAYCSGRYYGNLLDVMEPGLQDVFLPFIIDNTLFPEDWSTRTMRCSKRCHACGYCRDAAEQVFVDLSMFKEGRSRKVLGRTRTVN